MISFRPTTIFFILLASSNYLSAPFCHLSLHFKGLLKQLSKHDDNWLAGSPFWVSEVLDKQIHIQGGKQCRWTHGHNTSKLGPIFMVQLLSIDQDSNLCLTKDARCSIYMAPASFRQNLNLLKIGARLHSTILASGMWDFNVSNNNFNSGIRFVFLPLRIIVDTSGSGYAEHHTDNASTSDHRQSANIIWEIPECFANCQGTETLLVFTRCQILLLRRSAIRTHLSSHGFK